MSPEAIWSLLGLAAVIGVWAWHLHDMREYPQIACRKCHGAGWRVKWIWHVASMRPRKVRGECHRCHGSAWTDRRSSGSGWS